MDSRDVTVDKAVLQAGAERRLESVALPSPAATRAILVATDLVMTTAAAAVGALVWVALQPLADLGRFAALWPLSLAVPVGFWFLGLYPAAGVSAVAELRRTTLYVTGMFGATVSALFLSHQIVGASRGIFVLAWLFTVAAIPVGRSVLRRSLAHRSWWGLPALVLGAGRTAERLLESLRDDPNLDLKVLGCLDDDPAKRGASVAGVPVVGQLADAPRLQRAWRVSYGIVAMPGVAPERLATLVQRHAHVFPHLIVIPNMFGLTTVGVGTRELGSVVGLYNKQNLLLPHNRVLKRILDILLLVPIGVIGLPVVAFSALVVVLVSPGNPFYAQRREGYGGRPLYVWKLRTMRKDADAYLQRYLDAHPEAREEWQRHFKLAKDPRILPLVGRFLRRASLDELPQLLNILKGEMSFVGPRPFPYYHLEGFDAEFRQLRTNVVPGLTGLWQVTSRSTADVDAQVQLDSYYIRNWSLWMDLYLVARTPWAVLSGKGAY